MSKDGQVDSSLSERPGHDRPRRLVEWLNPTGARKVHSLIDKVYKRKNLEIAWERVRANQGSGGIDGESIAAFGERCEERLAQLHAELRTGSYRPSPVRQQRIPKAGKPGEWRMLGIPTVYDRVCQQALLNRLEPIFEPVFDDANFGYRRGRSTKDALRKVWREIEAGTAWIVDADLKDFFGTVSHEKLLALVAQRVSDGRVLRLIEATLTAGSYGEGRLFPTEQGMRRRGYQLTRYADDWVITCRSEAEAQAALAAASRVLEALGVVINPQKTRIVHTRFGFEFLGYKIKRGSKRMRLSSSKIKSGANQGALYAYPREKSIARFKDQVRQLTRRKAPVSTAELIQQLNPIVRGWGHYYKRAHVRRLFHRLDQWLVRRIWSHRHKRWRCRGWRTLPNHKLYGEYGLVNLVAMIPSIAAQRKASS